MMRRQDRVLTDTTMLLDILSTCKVCRLAMVDGNEPYVVPLNYGYTYTQGKLTLYFHCARAGRKVDILKLNPAVCFEVDCDHALKEGATACQYSYSYSSIIAQGRAIFLTGREEKRTGLQAIMRNMSGRDGFTFEDAQVDAVEVIAVEVENLSGKSNAAQRQV